MKKTIAEYLIEGIRAAGMSLWVEGGHVKGKMPNGQKCPMLVREMREQLGTVEAEAITVLQAETNRNTDIVMKGVPVRDALAVGCLVRSGRAELVGKVVYHKRSGLCDLKYRPLEAQDQE